MRLLPLFLAASVLLFLTSGCRAKKPPYTGNTFRVQTIEKEITEKKGDSTHSYRVKQRKMMNPGAIDPVDGSKDQGGNKKDD